MRKFTTFFAVALLLTAVTVYSQTDINSESKTVYRGTQSDLQGELNNVNNNGKQVPQYLLDQLEIANKTENLAEEERIMNIINSNYSNGVPANCTYGFMPGETEIVGNNNPPYNPDWMSSDILVYEGSSISPTRRTLDLKLGEDGNMYLAMCINGSVHGIRCYRSTNAGLNWSLIRSLIGGSTQWFTGLSMTVERRHASNNDSMRVFIFYTYSTTNVNNDNASLRLYSFLGNGSGTSTLVTIATPGTGNEYRWPSAFSNGAFQSTSTDIGVIIGEYENGGFDPGNLVNLRYFYMSNFSYLFTEYTNTSGNEDYWPSAAYKDAVGVDSVFIAVERRWATGDKQIRLFKIPLVVPPSIWFWETVTTNTSYFYREPCITIPQRCERCDEILITYLRCATTTATTGLSRYAFSTNYGVTFTNEATLGSSYSVNYTWIASDTNRTGNNYCISVFGDTDSLNVRRGRPNTMGTVYSDMTNHNLTGTAVPVCAIYNEWGYNVKQGAFSYWATGPANVYYDGENLPTNIKEVPSTVNSFSLSQNYPNPFNPATNINFSIPENSFVKIIVFDILGKEVATLINSEKSAGEYQIVFDASGLNSGIYFYKITAGNFTDIKKMILVR
ncbi:MAG: T9SS type A sorting domain-containing protein [Ignavibacteria bacterium]|nr:T9SS type A sorting domain-containing protein [Ignavibacteria bacterium]